MSLIGLIPAPWRFGAALVALAGAVAGAAVWHAGAIKAAEKRGHAALQAEMNAKALQAERAAREEEARRTAAQLENANEGQRIAARDRAAHAQQDARTAAADDGLRGAIAARTASGGAAAGDPAAAGQCAADAAALGAVLQACRAEYVSLARDADVELDDARRRGFECVADYESLTAAQP